MKVTKKDKKALGVIVIIILVCVVIFDLSPFGGSMRFYAKWIECGQKPVVLRGRPGFNWYEESAVYEFVRFGYQSYKCTPGEAERAGYSSDSRTWKRYNLDKE